MPQYARVGLVLVFLPVVFFAAGCNSGGGSVSREDGAELAHQNSLAEVGEMLRLRRSDAGKPPASSSDLGRYEIGFPVGVQKIKSGDIVLLFGAPVEDGASDKILAYDKETPELGGYVLMQDSQTIKKLSPEEFKGASKAPGKAEASK